MGGLAAEDAAGSSRSRARPFLSGERLVYRVRVAGVDAARATLSVGDPGEEAGRAYLPLRVTVEGYRWLTRFYPLQIKMITRVDPDTLRPLGMDREGTNGSLFRTVSLVFGPRGRVKVRVHIEGKSPRRYTRRTTPDAFDTVSGLYNIRAWLMTGEPRGEMVVFTGVWTRRVHVTRGPIEEVWTPAGWFTARRFEVEAEKIKVKGDRKRLPRKVEVERFSAWVTEDEHLVPVKLLGETPVGPAEVLLESQSRGAGRP